MQKLHFPILLMLLLCTTIYARAQKSSGKVSGVVYSDSTLLPLAGATVSLLSSRDSSLETVQVTDTAGRFVVQFPRPGKYILSISEINHLSYSHQVEMDPGSSMLELDTVRLPVRSNSMEAVVITRQLTPVIIKPDTVEFNAAAFRTKENDMVEDLLKKLPGVEVGKDGSIRAQGEKVVQLLVDGKPFFGNDPTTATQNLPAEIIDKVQLIDRKSEQAQVTGVNDGQKDKVINITIKKNKKRGSFGRGYVGYGTSDRYEARVSANHFYDARKMAFVGGSNNTGRSDYSSGENQESSSYNISNGVNRDNQAKLTFTDALGSKFDYSLHLSYTGNNNLTSQVRNRQNILGDSINYYDDRSEFSRKREGITGGFSFEYKPDSMTRIRVNQTGSIYRMENHSFSDYASTTKTRKVNEGSRDYNSHTFSPATNGVLNYSRSLKKKGRGIFFNFSNNINSSDTKGINQSENFFFPVGEPEYERLLDQEINSLNHSSNLFSSLSYNEPLDKNSWLSLSIGYNSTNTGTVRETRDFNTQSKFYDIWNDSLSNHFENATRNSTVGLNYSHTMKKGTFTVGSTWQTGYTSSRSLANDSLYEQHYQGFVPYIRFSRSGSGRSMSFGYNFSSRPPQAYQLQAIIDNTNPLFLRLGNPSLKYSSMHHLSFAYNYFNEKKMWSLNSSASFSAVKNNISNSTIYDPVTGVQTTMPVNLDGVYNLAGRMNLSIPVKLLGSRNTIFGTATLNLARNASLQDHQRNNSMSRNYSFNAGMTFQVKEAASFSLSYNLNRQQVSYSLRPEDVNEAIARGLDVSLGLYFSRRTEMQLFWSWDRNTGSMVGFNRNSHIINADLTQYMNRKRSWWLKLKVYDLLKQNINVYRYSGDSYLEDVRTNILTRYFLLSVNVKLSRFDKGRR